MRLTAASIVARLSLAGLSLAAPPPGGACASDHPRDPAGRPITVLTSGGALQDALQKSFFGPFTAQTRLAIRAGSWDGTLAALQNRARSGADPADRNLVLMENSSVLLACTQGLLLPIDPAAVPGLAPDEPNRLEPGAVSRCGIGAFRTDLVLAWDKSRIDTPPGWGDFWDVARHPGKRGLARDPRGTLEIALLADGVPPDEIYRTLATSDGLDRAFHKLDQLKPYIVWWDTPMEAMRIIESGSVLMSSAPNDAITAADLIGHRDFAIQWAQSLSTMLSWAIPGRPPPIDPQAAGSDSRPTGNAGTETPDRAQHVLQLLGFFGDPARQAEFIQRYPAASVLQDLPAADAALAEDSAAAPDHRHAALRQDDAFWLTALDPVRARFDAWIGR